ncbi:MAG TPA: hypothetical protein VMF66_00835 [Candidatus Acidoferrum sp.]|nr:hypothetical protein [Candidatus Acidoferrum sp.]
MQPVIGSIQGDGVAIASSASAISVPQDAAITAPITNGSVVTLGPGQARLMLALGGEIDVCGPAKFTLLQSGEAITVALDFGTLRLQLPESRNLRVFTPAIIATPVEIDGTPGDITLMLGQDDSLCVRAASGALLLESQFTNEKIVVPQAGQFWFEQGRLVPIARNDINCECLLPEARLAPSPSQAEPPIDSSTPAQIAAAGSSPGTAKPESERQAEEAGVEYGILARSNDSHPVAEQPKATPTQAPDLKPFYRVDMPPLAFSASSPAPPPAAAEQMILLIRTTKIDPDFEFTGHVNPPPMDGNAKNQSPKNAKAPELKSGAEKHGFWGKLKRFLDGGSS